MGAPFINNANALLQQQNAWNVPQQFASGSAGAPGISFSGDPDTGFYRSTANTFYLTTNGARRWGANASGALIGGSTGASVAGYAGDGNINLPAAAGIYCRNSFKALGTYTYSGGVPALADGFGMAAPTDQGVGYIRCNFTNTMADTNYVVLYGVDAGGDTTNAAGVTIFAKTTTYVELKIHKQASGPFDPVSVTVGIAGA